MKKVLTFVIIGIVVAGGILTYLYLDSFRNIVFDIKQPDVTLEVFKSSSNQPIKTITSTQTIPLQKGEYYYVTKGDLYEESNTPLVVENDSDVVVDPAYSRNYLSSMLAPQEKGIHEIISDTYSSVIGQFDIHKGELFGRGDWYGTILTKKVEDERQITDPYRVILKKRGDDWKIFGQPEIVVTTTNQPEVPVDILHQVNGLLSD